MKSMNNHFLGHLLIILTVLVWGITFISTKVLIFSNMGPMEIALYRFAIAYVILWVIHPHLPKTSLKQELYFFMSGFAGVTLYFLFENNALKYTTASNASFIVSTAPLLTAILAHHTTNEKIRKNFILGFIISAAGIFFIVFNGKFVLNLNPIGDLLAFLSAASWACYSILIKKLGNKYNIVYLNRKIFFYGLITILPFILFSKDKMDLSLLSKPVIAGNILFLGIIASALCYILWQKAVFIIGVVKTNNYIYLIPVVTAMFSVIILHEKITGLMLLGSSLIIIGLIISNETTYSYVKTFLYCFRKDKIEKKINNKLR